jgi:hypothetical protein
MAVTFALATPTDQRRAVRARQLIASALANERGGRSGAPASLIALGLVLFVLTFIVLACSRLLIACWRAARPQDVRAGTRPTQRSRRFPLPGLVNRFNLPMSLTAMAFGMAFLLDPGCAVCGAWRARPRAFPADDPTAGVGGRTANAISAACSSWASPRRSRRSISAGIYLAEYGRTLGRARHALHNDILLSAPSIARLFIYTIYVMKVGHFWAGLGGARPDAIPVVVRTTENMLQLVPASCARCGSVARRCTRSFTARCARWRWIHRPEAVDGCR